MRIVSLFAFCFVLAACTEEEVVTVLEPVDFDIDTAAVTTDSASQ